MAQSAPAASFTTLSGRPSVSDLEIDYVAETFELADGNVTAYTTQACTEAIEGDSITDYIGGTVYLKYNDVEIEDDNYGEVVTAVTIPARGDAPNFSASNITAQDTSLSFTGQGGCDLCAVLPGTA